MLYLGIDPARNGAAVLMDDAGRVSDVWCWRAHTKNKKQAYKIKHTELTDTGVILYETSVRDGGRIAMQIAQRITQPVMVVCESAYVNHRKPSSGLKVSRFGGMITGGLSAVCADLILCQEWIMASNWRHQVLQLPPFTKRELAKKTSLNMIPNMIPGIKPHLEQLGYDNDDVCDAAGLAIWMSRQETIIVPEQYITTTKK